MVSGGSKELHLKQASQHRLILSNIRNLRFNEELSTNAGGRVDIDSPIKSTQPGSSQTREATETRGTYNIKNDHTVHLAKSVAKNQCQNAPTQISSTSAPTGAAAAPAAAGVATNLTAGTGNNPLAGLTGARYAGFTQLPGAGMFGPDSGVSIFGFLDA